MPDAFIKSGEPAWLAEDRPLYDLLHERARLWLVTGGAGFIGSHLVETLLLAGQKVRVLDNFMTGFHRNLADVEQRVGQASWQRFHLVEGDIRDHATCAAAMAGVEHVLHQAALGSVPRSLEDPLTTNAVNIGGFLSVLEAARQARVCSFTYAASSSTYGDEPNLPKVEERVGNALSPYAVTKAVNEQYARVYAVSYGFASTGLRYFNVFGPRQDPAGAYAAVIPRWVAAMAAGEEVAINGDGETSRDFCYVANVVQANIRAALMPRPGAADIFNVAVGQRTSLNELFARMRDELARAGFEYRLPARYRPERPGDVRHSLADIGKAGRVLGYRPTHDLEAGLAEVMPWYLLRLRVQGNVPSDAR